MDNSVLVKFVKRKSIPIDIIPGTFYWVENEGDKIQLWFTSESNGLILLNEDITEKIAEVEGDIEAIQGILEGIDLSSYLTDSDLEGYVTMTELDERLEQIADNIELTDSDYDAIAERIGGGDIDLTWREI